MTSVRLSLIVAHALCVVAGLAYLVLAVVGHGDAPDANIGAGLALLWLAALGSPWTWPLWEMDEVFEPVRTASTILGALANLLVHTALSVRAAGRRKRDRLS